MDTVVFAATVWKLVDFFRQLANWKTNKSGIVTQLLAWAGGVVAVVLAAHASAVELLVLPGMTEALGTLDGGSQLLAGVMVGSTASAAVDFKQALDGHDDASKPPLFNG